MSAADQSALLFGEQLVRFVRQPSPADRVLASLAGAIPAFAVIGPAQASDHDSGSLHVRLLSRREDLDGASDWFDKDTLVKTAEESASVSLEGVEVLWRPGRAVLLCDVETAGALLPVLAAFAYYEGQLRLIEAEVEKAWPELEQDTPLAFESTTQDLQRSGTVGERMGVTLRRRIRLARLERPICAPTPADSDTARALDEALREQSQLSDRYDLVSGQVEVFEGIYELSSQRIAEYRASHQGHLMEVIIIVLLALEILMMLWQVLAGIHR